MCPFARETPTAREFYDFVAFGFADQSLLRPAVPRGPVRSVEGGDAAWQLELAREPHAEPIRNKQAIHGRDEAGLPQCACPLVRSASSRTDAPSKRWAAAIAISAPPIRRELQR